MGAYVSRPAEIEAIQWIGQNSDEVRAFINNEHASQGGLERSQQDTQRGALWVAKSQRWCDFYIGGWVIREPDGSGVYPCEDEVFKARWQPKPPQVSVNIQSHVDCPRCGWRLS